MPFTVQRIGDSRLVLADPLRGRAAARYLRRRPSSLA
jgi:hypothetical protein